MEPIIRPSDDRQPPARRLAMQPIIFDHVKKVVVRVGTDPESAKKYEELVAAQQPPAASKQAPDK
jgi:hypothetical protein